MARRGAVFLLRPTRDSKDRSGFPGTQLKSLCPGSSCFSPGSHFNGVILSFSIVYLAASFKYFDVLLFFFNGVCMCMSLISKGIRPEFFCTF